MPKHTEGELIQNPKNNKIPNQIVKAYQKYAEAEKEFSRQLKTNYPPPPVEVGQKVFIMQRYNDYWEAAVIQRMSYDPYTYYTNGTFGGWYITAGLMKKDFSKLKQGRYSVPVGRGCKMKMAISE